MERVVAGTPSRSNVSLGKLNNCQSKVIGKYEKFVCWRESLKFRDYRVIVVIEEFDKITTDRRTKSVWLGF